MPTWKCTKKIEPREPEHSCVLVSTISSMEKCEWVPKAAWNFRLCYVFSHKITHICMWEEKPVAKKTSFFYFICFYVVSRLANSTGTEHLHKGRPAPQRDSWLQWSYEFSRSSQPGLNSLCCFPDSFLYLQTTQSLNSQIIKHADCHRGDQETKRLPS